MMGMELNKSTRKPYVRPVKANWWSKKGFYLAYMLREGTSILSMLFVLEMLAFYAGVACKNESLMGIVFHPVTAVLNLIVLAAVVYHAITWFALMPKAQRVIINNKLLDGKYFVWALYAILAIVTIAGVLAFFTPAIKLMALFVL